MKRIRFFHITLGFFNYLFFIHYKAQVILVGLLLLTVNYTKILLFFSMKMFLKVVKVVLSDYFHTKAEASTKSFHSNALNSAITNPKKTVA